MKQVSKKTLGSEDNIVFQCLDKTPPQQLAVAKKKGSELHGTEPIDIVLEKDSKDQYVLDGLLTVEEKTLACEGMVRAIKGKGYNIVCLNEYDGDVAALMAENVEKSDAEKLQDQTRELAEASESLKDAQAQIAALEAEVLELGTNNPDA